MAFSNNNREVKPYLGEGGAIGAGIAVIKGTADNQAKLPTASYQMPLGITLEASSAAGDTLQVVEEGVCDAVVDGSGTAITAGDPLTVKDATGVLIKSDLANTHNVCAVARESASAASVRISVRICRSFMPAS